MSVRYEGTRRGAAILLVASLGSVSVAALQLVPVIEEIRIGQEAQREIRQTTPEVTDGTVKAYVERLGSRLAAHASGAEYPYTFTVANSRDLNAFALPGGPVWVHRGVLDSARREAQVAGVLAHEIAHISQRHAADQLTKGLVAQGLLGLLGAVVGSDGAGAAVARVAAGATVSGAMLKFSRDDEREADREGVRLMERAGIDPRGLLEFMQTLEATQGRSPGSVAQFLSSHPAPAERVRELAAMVGDARAGEGDAAAFTEMKRRLAQLPAAPAPARR